MNWLKFKNNYSNDFDLITVNLGRRKRAEEQIDSYEIPYRNDELTIHSNTFKSYIRNVEFANRNNEKTSLINQWLVGRGKLRTSLDINGYFIASVVTALSPEKMMNNVDGFTVGFKVNPFFYLDIGDENITLETQTTLVNLGTIYSEPYIKINGTGDITLTINSTNYFFTAVDGYIEIDSELKLIYKDTLNQGEKMSGELPVLEVGNNVITWAGNVTSVEIIPKWREL